MTDINLEALKILDQEATPTPWAHSMFDANQWVPGNPRRNDAMLVRSNSRLKRGEDLDLIVAMRNNFRGLIEENERLKAEIAKMNEAIRAWDVDLAQLHDELQPAILSSTL